jgi:hypothetical protein
MGRSSSLKKSFKASVKKQKKKIASGQAYASRSKKDLVKSGVSFVKSNIGFNQTKHPTEGIVDSYALKSKKGGKGMYGSEASDSTDNYLVSIGEAKVGNYFKQVGGESVRLSKAEGEKLYKAGVEGVSRSYMVTSKGREIKYGKSGGAMGSGDNTGIMGSVPISEQMFESQRKLKTGLIAGLSFFMPNSLLATGMRAIAFGEHQKKYGSYRDRFDKNMGKSFVASSIRSNEAASNETANLAMGTTYQDTNKKKKSTHKTTSKFYKGSSSTGYDESSKKRFFLGGAR